jgi:hypothetical protein
MLFMDGLVWTFGPSHRYHQTGVMRAAWRGRHLLPSIQPTETLVALGWARLSCNSYRREGVASGKHGGGSMSGGRGWEKRPLASPYLMSSLAGCCSSGGQAATGAGAHRGRDRGRGCRSGPAQRDLGVRMGVQCTWESKIGIGCMFTELVQRL